MLIIRNLSCVWRRWWLAKNRWLKTLILMLIFTPRRQQKFITYRLMKWHQHSAAALKWWISAYYTAWASTAWQRLLIWVTARRSISSTNIIVSVRTSKSSWNEQSVKRTKMALCRHCLAVAGRHLMLSRIILLFVRLPSAQQLICRYKVPRRIWWSWRCWR